MGIKLLLLYKPKHALGESTDLPSLISREPNIKCDFVLKTSCVERNLFAIQAAGWAYIVFSQEPQCLRFSREFQRRTMQISLRFLDSI